MPLRKDHKRPQRSSYRKRQVDTIEPIERFLIISEGAETERRYFQRFDAPGTVVLAVGTGMNTLSLVDEAVRVRDVEVRRLRKLAASFDECWCVFDRDSFARDHFNNAVRKAEAAGFQVGYSNQCFELWYVLHFRRVESALHRTQYYEILGTELGRRYDKADDRVYDELTKRESDAIRNAAQLHAQFGDIPPEQKDPCTTVHILVERLRRSSRRCG